MTSPKKSMNFIAAWRDSKTRRHVSVPFLRRWQSSTRWLRLKAKVSEMRLQHDARRRGVLPLVSAILAGHPYIVHRGRLWVFMT